MAVVIRLMRAGAKKRPFYRMVAADSRRQRDGRFLEILGHYNPLAQPYELVVHKDKVQNWLARGAQPSEQAASLLRSLGISKPAPIVAQPTPTVSKEEKKAAKQTKLAAKRAAKKAAPKSAVRKVSARKAEKKTVRKAAAKKKAAK
jgi:small subunit ribosomal protein S16